jgi:hypothetical protein
MLSKGNVIYRHSLRRRNLTIIVLCSIVWWASASALAQQASPTGLKIAADPASSSFKMPGTDQHPYLVIGMTDRWETQPYASFRMAGDTAASPSPGNTIMRQMGPAASADRTETIASSPLLLSSLLDPSARVPGLTNSRSGYTSPRHTNQTAPDLANAKVYSLLDDWSAPGSFLYGHPAGYLPSTQLLADTEFFTQHEAAQAPRPLLQLEIGGWPFQVLLSKQAGLR